MAGFDITRQGVEAKARLGYSPRRRPYLYGKLTGRELLRFLSRLRGVSDGETKISAWLERFNLTDVGNELVETYSHGMRQKLTFIAALLHDPEVLVIDEPMVGLDPRAARDVRELMSAYASKGHTVLLTTHSMEVAQASPSASSSSTEAKSSPKGIWPRYSGVSGTDHENFEDLEAIFLRLTEEAHPTAPAL